MKINGFVITHPLIQNPDNLKPHIQIQFPNSKHKYLAFVDTGSTISIITEAILHKIFNSHPKLNEWGEGPIMMLDGSEVDPEGTITLTFELGHKTFNHSFAVMKSHNQILIGMDFLRQCGLMLDCYGVKWEFSDTWSTQKYPLIMQNPVNNHICNLQTLKEFEGDQIKELLKLFPDVVDAPLGRIRGIKHVIKLIEEHPKRQRPYPTSPLKQKEINNQIQQMLDMGVIRKSNSPYSSPVLIIY